MRKRSAALATCMALFLVGPAAAQPDAKSDAKPKAKPRNVDERLGELSSRVDEAMRSAADSAAALKALQDVQRQLAELRQEAARHKSAVIGHQDAQRMLDRNESRLGNAELQLAALKLAMSSGGDMAGYNHGFYVGAPNRRFLLRFNGLLQAGYEGKINFFTGGAGGFPADGQLGKNDSTFLLRRASTAFSGHVFMPEIAYYLELNFGTAEAGPLLEGWAEIQFHRLLRLRGGKQKVPVGRQLLTHGSGLQFTDRSGTVLAFAPGWDLGAVLHGDLPVKGGLSYQLGIFNGAGSNAVRNDNIDLLYAVRVTAAPLGHVSLGEGDPESSPFRFALGASFAYNLAPTDLALRKGVTDAAEAARISDKEGKGNGNVDNVAIYTVGAELVARYAGASLQSEFFYRREDAGHIGGDEKLFGSSWGMYSQAGYFLPFGIELAARYSYWEPTYYGESRLIYRPGKVHELGAVANFLMWRRLVKWQIEYDHQWQRDLHTATTVWAGGANVNLVRLQMQVAF